MHGQTELFIVNPIIVKIIDIVMKNNIETILAKARNPAVSVATKTPLYQSFKSGAKRAGKFLLSCIGLGAFDALHPKSIDGYATKAGKWLGKYMPNLLQFVFPISSQLYQVGLMAGDFGAGALALHNPKASKKENLANLITGPANAVGMDYSSASIAAGKPVYPLPKADWGWRINAFKHTAYGGLANLVNAPSFIPGLLAGYVLGLLSLAVYGGVKAGLWLYKNPEKVKTWAKGIGTRIQNGVDSAIAAVKKETTGAYMYMTNKLKQGYTYVTNGLKGFANKIIPEAPAIGYSYLNINPQRFFS